MCLYRGLRRNIYMCVCLWICTAYLYVLSGFFFWPRALNVLFFYCTIDSFFHVSFVRMFQGLKVTARTRPRVSHFNILSHLVLYLTVPQTSFIHSSTPFQFFKRKVGIFFTHFWQKKLVCNLGAHNKIHMMLKRRLYF